MIYGEMLFNITLWFYLIATLLYIGFMVLLRREIGLLATITAFLGWVANTAALGFRWSESGHVPLSNQYESMIFMAWAVILFYLCIEYKYRDRVRIVGSVVVFLGFLSIAVASLLPYRYQAAEPLVPALQSYWLHIHVTTTFIGYAGFTISFALSILYLLKARAEVRVGQGGAGVLARFPESYFLDDLSYRAIAMGFPFLTMGIITGAIWANYAWGTYWSWDPKETWSLITWLIYAAYLHARITAGWRGKRTAYLSIIGYASVIFTYFGVNFLLTGLHAYG
jgi:cytochrome c-type biogenesis protein CcsB